VINLILPRINSIISMFQVLTVQRSKSNVMTFKSDPDQYFTQRGQGQTDYN